MSDGYDRYETEGGSGGSFVMGLLAGTVLGAGLGMLFAPKAGSELRSQLSEQAGTVRDKASAGYRKASETAGDWAAKGRDMVDKARETGRDMADRARDTASRVGEEGQRFARDIASSASSGGRSGLS